MGDRGIAKNVDFAVHLDFWGYKVTFGNCARDCGWGPRPAGTLLPGSAASRHANLPVREDINNYCYSVNVAKLNLLHVATRARLKKELNDDAHSLVLLQTE